MNIGKFFRFLRRDDKNDKQLHWHAGQFVDNPPAQGENTTIVEFQDRWTKMPTRIPIRFNNGSSRRGDSNTNFR